MRESNSWTRRGLEGGRHWSVCKLRVAGPPCHRLPAAVLSCLYYLRLEVEKLDLRVGPAFFFFSPSPHRPLHTWPCQSLFETGLMAGRAGEQKNVRRGREGVLGTFPFTSPQWLFLFISASTRRTRWAAWNPSPSTVPWGQTTDAPCIHVNVYVTHVHTETQAENCVTLQGHSVR